MRCTSTVVEHLAAFILTSRRVFAAVQHPSKFYINEMMLVAEKKLYIFCATRAFLVILIKYKNNIYGSATQWLFLRKTQCLDVMASGSVRTAPHRTRTDCQAIVIICLKYIYAYRLLLQYECGKLKQQPRLKYDYLRLQLSNLLTRL